MVGLISPPRDGMDGRRIGPTLSTGLGLTDFDAHPSRAESVRGRWVSDVADADVIRFAVWLVLLLAIIVSSTAVVTHEAEARAPADLSGRYLASWAIASGVSVLVLSFLGGLLVFESMAKWEVVVTWPLLGGLIVCFGSFVTLVAMGQTEPGSVSCEAGNQSCEPRARHRCDSPRGGFDRSDRRHIRRHVQLETPGSVDPVAASVAGSPRAGALDRPIRRGHRRTVRSARLGVPGAESHPITRHTTCHCCVSACANA